MVAKPRPKGGASIAELAEMLSYDPETGQFSWKIKRRRAKVGFLNKSDRYIYVQVRGKNYAAHRLAFALMTGSWPSGEVDHINGNRSDNRWVNLREASRSENMRNVGRKAGNSVGIKGVSRCHTKSERWRASIVVDRKHIHLGSFSTPEEAAAAYEAAARLYHGDFANTGRRSAEI